MTLSPCDENGQTESVFLCDIYFFFLSSSKRLDRSSKSISSSLLFPSVEFGTSGKSNGTFGKLDKSSLTVGGADADGGGDIFDLGCGFGVLFKF